MRVLTLDGGSSLSGIRKQIRAELNDAGAPPGPAFDCLVAVTEACTNALIHGRTEASKRSPELCWSIDERRALFEITDYSHKEGAERSDGEKEERYGGFGLPMMRRLMDFVDVRFSPVGTSVVLEKRFEHRAG